MSVQQSVTRTKVCKYYTSVSSQGRWRIRIIVNIQLGLCIKIRYNNCKTSLHVIHKLYYRYVHPQELKLRDVQFPKKKKKEEEEEVERNDALAKQYDRGLQMLIGWVVSSKPVRGTSIFIHCLA